jgi:Predicted sugar phosphatases of the HAD superfamily
VTLAGRYDLVVFDLDGVVYVGAQAVPGAPEAIRALVAAGTPVAYATNNGQADARPRWRGCSPASGCRPGRRRW